jgi:uncharacterized protein YkwD
MSGKSRAFLLAISFTTLLGFAVVSSSDASAAGRSLAQGQDGTVQIAGLDLEIDLLPAAVSPGDVLSLNLVLFNHREEVAVPEVLVSLPNNLSVNPTRLPRGASFNVAENTLSWQPVVQSVGGSEAASVNVAVNSVELNSPEQAIRISLRDGGIEQVFIEPFWIGVMPKAQIQFEPARAAVGQPVRLVGVVEGPGPVTQEWALGDGRTVNATDPMVVYPEVGSYNVILKASNPLGLAISSAALSVVPEVAAAFSPVDIATGVNQPISFVNQSGGQGTIDYRWDFGDGSGSREVNPVHRYTAPGTYQVRLVADNDLGQSEAAGTVVVGVAPLADVLLPNTADAGRLLEFQALIDNTVTEVHWNLGDGHSVDGLTAEHVYWTPGQYPVSMTAVNQFGETTVVRLLEVEPGMLFLYLPLLQATEESIIPQVPETSVTYESLEAIEVTQPPELQALDLPPELTPAEQLIIYVNEARRLNNLPGLNYSQELGVAAQGHTDDMAANAYVGHSGSDGSTPAYRIRQAGYAGGYGGEATAWGMQSALDVVNFWLGSPAHRLIILNPAVTDLGVGYTQNFASANFWYWTAEFASLNLPVIDVGPLPEPTNQPDPTLMLLGPPQGSEFELTPANNLIFTWSWPLPLQPGERFLVIFHTELRPLQVGIVDQSQPTGQYQLKIPAQQIPAGPGTYQWQVRLENAGEGDTSQDSAWWPILLAAPTDPGVEPTATPSSEDIVQPTPTRPPSETGDGQTPLPVATPIPVPES